MILVSCRGKERDSSNVLSFLTYPLHCSRYFEATIPVNCFKLQVGADLNSSVSSLLHTYLPPLPSQRKIVYLYYNFSLTCKLSRTYHILFLCSRSFPRSSFLMFYYFQLQYIYNHLAPRDNKEKSRTDPVPVLAGNSPFTYLKGL